MTDWNAGPKKTTASTGIDNPSLEIQRLQKRVNDLETLIREALNALDDQDDKPVWINKNTTMREAFYWSLQPTPESRGERPLLEIPA